jgi:hypothetical protein
MQLLRPCQPQQRLHTARRSSVCVTFPAQLLQEGGQLIGSCQTCVKAQIHHLQTVQPCHVAELQLLFCAGAVYYRL